MPLRRLGVTAAALLLTACGSPQVATPTSADGTAQITVVTSTNVYGSVASAVAGDLATVQPLITDPAADPHSYESTPADAAKVAGATVVVLNGGGYDDWMPGLVESAGADDQAVIDVAELSGLVPDPALPEGGFNEHFWYSLPTVQTLASRLAIDLGKADAPNAARYTANAAAFNAKLDELTARAEAIGAARPGARVAITEPIPAYLIEAAGLTDVTPKEFAEAIEEDTDPPAAVLQQTLALFGTDPVTALILNVQLESTVTDQVRQAAQAAGVPVVEVTETLPAGATDYVSWMGAQIDALAGALKPA